MGNLSYKERYLRALRKEPVDRVPVPAFCTHPLVELMDQTGLYAPHIHWRLPEMVGFAMAGHEVLGFEGVRLPTDGVIEAEAMGCRIEPGKVDRNPSVADHPFSLDNVEIPGNFLERGRIPLVLEAVETIKGKVGAEIPVTCHFMGPVTISCHLVSSEVFLLGLLDNQRVTRKVLESVTDICIEMGNVLDEAGADVLELADPMASTDIVSPGMFEEFVLPCYRRIFEQEACPVVLHICGNATPLLPYLKDSGAKGFSFDSNVAVSHSRDTIGNGMALIGNISTTDTLLRGSKTDVRKETLKAIRDGIDVVSPGCGLAPRTPLENVKEMIRSARCI